MSSYYEQFDEINRQLDRIMKVASEHAPDYGRDCRLWSFLDYDDFGVEVEWSEKCLGDTRYEYRTIPWAWFELDEDELISAFKASKEVSA